MPVTDTSLALSWHSYALKCAGHRWAYARLVQFWFNFGSSLAWEDSLQGNDEIERQKWLHVVMRLASTDSSNRLGIQRRACRTVGE